MRISRIKLKNYVSFYDEDAEDIELGPGINFIVGKNNSGKTALIDALTPGRSRASHRSMDTVYERDSRPSRTVRHEIEYEFHDSALPKILRKKGEYIHVGVSRDYVIDNETLIRLLQELFSGTVRLRYYNNPHRVRLNDFDIDFDVRVYQNPANIFRFNILDDLTLDQDSLHYGTRLEDHYETCWQTVNGYIQKSTYRFDAERQVAAHTPTQNNLTLESDASNLAQAMDTASRERTYQYNLLLDLVKYVYPDVHEIVIRKFSKWSNEDQEDVEYFEIYVGYLDPSEQREDLRVPLSGCGTGVGQVIALLYVVAVSEDSHVILMDEPHSFLHPEAVRRLLAIFQMPEFAHHQYILTTHSPTAIMSVQKKQILLVKRHDMVSTVKGVNVDDNSQLEEALEELGTRRSDIFGMDAVIWVEGKTDVVCFKMIWEHEEDHLPHGTSIFGPANTGDLENRKHANIAVEIYQNLSGGAGLLPSVLGFVFDGDKDGAHGRLEEEYKDLMHYLPRQTYENYFLKFPEILVQILNEHHISRPQDYGRFQVDQWINGNKIKQHYYRDGFQYDELSWVCEIKGAKFIEEMYLDLSGSNYSYRKAKFGPIITKRILAQNPDHFQEIVDLITCILEKDKQRETA